MNPTRIQRQRTKGWSKPPRCMIVDRTSHFGNPFTINQFIALGHQEPEARTMAVAQFRQWLHGSRAAWTSDDSDRRREQLLTRLPELRGMDLACPCGPGDPCHGDVLLEWAALSHLALEVRTAATRAPTTSAPPTAWTRSTTPTTSPPSSPRRSTSASAGRSTSTRATASPSAATARPGTTTSGAGASSGNR